MSAPPIIARSIGNLCRRTRSKPYLSRLFGLGNRSGRVNPIAETGEDCQWWRKSYRNLILQSDYSESVKMERLSDSDSGVLGIIEVKLDRPTVKNAIGRDMLKGLQHALEVVTADSTANVLVISSSVPRVFCAGADLKSLCIPTIAVIEGVALGGGLEMALSCDLRICGEDATFGLPETGLAIIPGAGGTQRLPRLVGKSVAKEIIFTGRKLDAKEAHSIGLVNYCLPAGGAHLKALEIARDINQKDEAKIRIGHYHEHCFGFVIDSGGPLAIKMAKRAIDEGLEVDLSSALALEEECYQQVLESKDRLEGLAAFSEKRKPIYTGE
ncbi:hypothetical protein Scep_026644 [Stephania cephalantha]|uniref:Uncharacterized protein n=1 Tax=Stephania cephalantha TaxID=152367 RepID=A0AAP0HTH6_9MAGN